MMMIIINNLSVKEKKNFPGMLKLFSHKDQNTYEIV